MSKKVPDAETWFERADQFQLAALTLMNRPRQQQGPFVVPHIVLKAFSTEAYLKCLITLGGGEAPQIHNLLELFRLLSGDAKRAIRRRWAKEYEPALRSLKKQDTAVVVPTTLEGVLNQSGDAFVFFRYFPKGAEAGFTMMNFPLFVREYILKQHPDWRPQPHDPLEYEPQRAA